MRLTFKTKIKRTHRPARLVLLMLTLAFGALTAQADVTCDDDFGQVCIEVITDGNSIKFKAENRHELAPVTLTIDVTTKNLRRVSGGSGPFVLDGSERREIFTYRIAPSVAWRYDYTFTWSLGDINAPVDIGYRYALPFAPGTAFSVGQSCNGRFSHFDKRRYAIDFDMPIGTPIHAARAGRVVAVKEDSNRGGPAQRYENDGNHIVIQHNDRTLAQYFHLRRDGAAVRLGDTVRKGQLIGYSGNTGRSTGPHLHFDVIKGARGTISETLPITFATTSGPVTCPKEGAQIRRQ